MLAVQPVSLADALLFDSPRFLARKRQCLRLPCNSAAFTADLAALTAGVAAFTADSTSFTESDSVYDLTLSVPGVRASDISATIEEHTLHVKGETKTQHRHMRFDRSIALPKDADVGSEGLKLVHEDGILTISVPKREPYRKQLEISLPGQAAVDGVGEASTEQAPKNAAQPPHAACPEA